MKILKSEKGYALFLTVLIIVLFGILTVSLLTIVMSGVSKNTIREDVTKKDCWDVFPIPVSFRP